MAAVRTQTRPGGADLYTLHRDYVLAILARRCGWLASDEREAILHDAYVVLLEKQQRDELDPDAMRPPQIRAYLVQTAINKALDAGKRVERKRSEPLGEGDAIPALADPRPGPEESAAAHQQDAWIRELIAELPERQQAVVKLRYFFDRTPTEIQDYLGMTQRTYRRQMERAMATISDRYALIREGQFCDSRRELIVAYVAGTADPDRARLAREHLASCRGCASWVAELRSGAGKVAVLLPVPALPRSGGAFERAGEGFDAARHAMGDGVVAVKQHAASLLARVDPSNAVGAYASGSRPGAAVAAIAGCVAIGGGTATYCAVDGVPDPIRSLVGLERTDERKPEPKRAVAPEPPEQAPVARPPEVDSAPQPPPAETATSTAAEPAGEAEPKPAPEREAPPLPPPDEFSLEAASASPASEPVPATSEPGVAPTSSASSSEAAPAEEFGP